jgi:hypothetical protein
VKSRTQPKKDLLKPLSVPAKKPLPKPKPPSIYPESWSWFVDEAIPQTVKERYSSKKSWASKPFSKLDAEFYFRGLQDLALLFTEERDERLPNYFRQPRSRSSYLLYYLPLHAAKFLSILQEEDGAGLRFKALKNSALDRKELRILDLGAGPGTASFAFLLLWIDLTRKEPALRDLKISFDWMDLHPLILKDGLALAEKFKEKHPWLRERLSIRTTLAPWWQWEQLLPRPEQNSTEPLDHPVAAKPRANWDVVLMGNVLNERQTQAAEDRLIESLTSLVPHSTLGILMVEPAAKGPAQRLGRIRDEILPAFPEIPRPWTPCLHAGKCPLALGRDWCHFSVPSAVPGVWFKTFSRMLSSERLWIKYSHLWLASPHCLPPVLKDPKLRLVVSNPIRIEKDGRTFVLICEPEHPVRLPLRTRRKDQPDLSGPFRGDRIQLE